MSLIMTIGGVILPSYAKIRFFHIRTSDKFLFIAKYVKKRLLATALSLKKVSQTLVFVGKKP